MMHTIAAKAVCFHEAMQPDFTKYQQAILDNAQALAAELRKAGFNLVSGGTDNHIVLVDLTGTGVTGRQAETALSAAGIVVNRNAVPFDKLGPTVTSGMRLGTPAVTTRGFGTAEIKQVAGLIIKIIQHPADTAVTAQAREEVAAICARLPIPGIND